ncbi:hypothetical protein EDD37DRAFT_640518 [Exophiala viscosa]|uniref:Uncharacterized protein n=1 Tax=Exophiala viscosa TaxID=2486360 RepID=A0AAN6IA15_9EURO|nr:hypothetical protein EDD36DRAFT_422325 [Exophiala viscosa]KAI1620611.1 hypothetical protein EDD37DRAFT_640518 [Exophiala viscosa]
MSEQYSTGGSRQPATYNAVTGGGVPETDSSQPIAHGCGLEGGSSYQGTQSGSNNYSDNYAQGSSGLGSSGFAQNDGYQNQTSSRLPETDSSYRTTEYDSNNYSNNDSYGSSGLGTSDRTQGQTSTFSGTQTGSGPINHSDDSNPLNEHHRPSVAMDGQQGVDSLEGETNIRRAGDSQNAPGKLGDTGESLVGAMGFGGSQVGRPKEDQGIGEKIANFLGV